MSEDIVDNATVGCGRTLFLLDPSGVTPTIKNNLFLFSFFLLPSPSEKHTSRVISLEYLYLNILTIHPVTRQTSHQSIFSLLSRILAPSSAPQNNRHGALQNQQDHYPTGY